MALAKMGGGVVQLSGSIAGNVFARNRFGNYVRPRTKPVNPNSTHQSGVRDALSYLANQWSAGLTAGQRTAWQTYGNAVAMKNRLGETVYITGFNHFLRSNIERSNRALGTIYDGPTELSLPEKDTTFAVSGSAATQQLSITFNNGLAWANENSGFLAVYQGEPQLVTRNFFNGPWRYMDRIDGNAGSPPTSPDAMNAPFTLVEGQKVWVYGRIIRADGRVSEPMYASCTVAA